MVEIGLWYKKPDGSRSDLIPGLGGNMLVANESKGPRTSDECYKGALTDAISVAGKALGLGADVYWGNDVTKYTVQGQQTHVPRKDPPPAKSEEVMKAQNMVDAAIRKRCEGISPDEKASIVSTIKSMTGGSANYMAVTDMNILRALYERFKM